MGLAETQALLAKLFTDRPLREQFFEDPIAVGTSLGLENDQVTSLAGLDASGVEAFADSLDRKRRDDLAKIFPIITRAIIGEYHTVFRLFANEHPHQKRSGHLADAQAFVKFLTNRTVSTEVPLPCWLPDLARYEIAFRQAVISSRHFRILKFQYPVQEIAALVLENRTIPLRQSRRAIALWFRLGSRGQLRHLVFSLVPRIRAKP